MRNPKPRVQPTRSPGMTHVAKQDKNIIHPVRVEGSVNSPYRGSQFLQPVRTCPATISSTERPTQHDMYEQVVRERNEIKIELERMQHVINDMKGNSQAEKQRAVHEAYQASEARHQQVLKSELEQVVAEVFRICSVGFQPNFYLQEDRCGYVVTLWRHGMRIIEQSVCLCRVALGCFVYDCPKLTVMHSLFKAHSVSFFP